MSKKKTLLRVALLFNSLYKSARLLIVATGFILLYGDARKHVLREVLTEPTLPIYVLLSAVYILLPLRNNGVIVCRLTYAADLVVISAILIAYREASALLFLMFIIPISFSLLKNGTKEGVITSIIAIIITTFNVLIKYYQLSGAINYSALFLTIIFSFLIAYFTVYWTARCAFVFRQAALMLSINEGLNPRYGVDRIIGFNLDRLVGFFNATSCVITMQRPDIEHQYIMYTALQNRPGHGALRKDIDEAVSIELSQFSSTLAIAYHAASHSLANRLAGYFEIDMGTGLQSSNFRDKASEVANLLDATSFVSVPYNGGNGTTGRIYVLSSTRTFNKFDIEALEEFTEAMTNTIENICLMETLITSAAEYERQSISRDIHDGTIQPYIGLKLALDALLQKTDHNDEIVPCIKEISEMAGATINDLRSHMTSLREKTSMPGDVLPLALAKQAERLFRFYGIVVEVKTEITSHFHGHLAAELFHIVSEGLSNIIRHTAAKRAFVNLKCDASYLTLEIGNESKDTLSVAKEFFPRSIFSRAEWLGGSVRVNQHVDGFTVVHVAIPNLTGIL